MYASVLSAVLDVLDFSLICSRRGGKTLISRASARTVALLRPTGGKFRLADLESPGRTMMRRTTRIVALSMLGAALMLSAAATVPRSASSDELRAITLYTDPASGQVFTKRCKHCVRLGEYMPTGSTEEIEQKVERRVKR